MKKYFTILILVITVILVTGCSNNDKEIIKTCTSTANDIANGYKLESEYKIYAKGDVVEKVETIEKVTSDDEMILEYFEETLEETYDTSDEVYGGYENEIDVEDGVLVSKTTIDYNVMDLDKYVKDNSVMKNYVNSDNKLLLDGIISIYESLGATCE